MTVLLASHFYKLHSISLWPELEERKETLEKYQKLKNLPKRKKGASRKFLGGSSKATDESFYN